MAGLLAALAIQQGLGISVHNGGGESSGPVRVVALSAQETVPRPVPHGASFFAEPDQDRVREGRHAAEDLRDEHEDGVEIVRNRIVVATLLM